MSSRGITNALPEWAAREVVESRRARLGIGVAAFVLATTFGAYVAVPLPFTPVPVTLQPLFVILAGALLGARGGAAAMAAYVAIGATGAPVFSAGHGGLVWLMGPTGGYLLAYPAAAFAVGALAAGSRSPARILGGLVVGMALIYLGGVSQLWILTRQDPAVLLQQGVLPFLIGDVAKIFVALAVVMGVRRSGLDRDSRDL